MAYAFVQAVENSSSVGTTGFPAIAGQGTQVASASQTVANPGVFTTATQAYVAGQPVYLTGTAPGGFALNTVYYVIAAGLTTTSLQLAATVGGAGIQCTSSAACTINPTVITTAGNTLIGIIHANTAGSGSITDKLGNVFSLIGHCDNTANAGDWLYLCQNAVGGGNIFSSSWNGSNLSGFWVGEYSGLALSGGVLASKFNTINGTSNGANALVTASMNVPTVPAMLFGYAFNNTGSFAPTAGTSPIAFNTRGPNFPNYTGGVRAVAEDARLTSGGNYIATFGTGSVGADNWNMLAIALAELGAIGPGGVSGTGVSGAGVSGAGVSGAGVTRSANL